MLGVGTKASNTNMGQLVQMMLSHRSFKLLWATSLCHLRDRVDPFASDPVGPCRQCTQWRDMLFVLVKGNSQVQAKSHHLRSINAAIRSSRVASFGRDFGMGAMRHCA